jgi:inorganic triphosphatase YgiF
VAIEIELKLALAPGAAAALLRHPELKARRRGRERTARVISTYFDTPDFRLAKEGIALRIRRIDRRWVQTIKGPPEADSGGGLHARGEFEWRLARPRLDLHALATTPWHAVIAKATQHDALTRCFTTAFERRRVPLRFADGTLASLYVDHGEIRGIRRGRLRRVPISEIEIELESGASANLFELALRIAADLPVALLTASKAERGYGVLRGERDPVPAPLKARGVELAENASTVEALALIARECLHQIAANAPGLCADTDAEWVHQMRIGTRRLRSCLVLIDTYAPSAALEPLVADVKWLASELGGARDWDVFVDTTLPPLVAWFAHDASTAAGLRRLRTRAQRRRRAAREAARAAVRSRRFQRLLLAGGLLCTLPHLGAAVPAIGTQPPEPPSAARAFAADLLAQRQHKLATKARALVHGSPAERHAARIAAKRLRYAAEFFASLYPRKHAKAYSKALAGLQDVLGQLNDAATALSLVNEAGGADAATIGAVRGWVAHCAAALEPHLAAAARRLAQAEPFWS